MPRKVVSMFPRNPGGRSCADIHTKPFTVWLGIVSLSYYILCFSIHMIRNTLLIRLHSCSHIFLCLAKARASLLCQCGRSYGLAHAKFSPRRHPSEQVSVSLSSQVYKSTIKMMIQSNCLSEVDVKLSQVNVLMSEINQLISQCPVPVQSRKLLPRINVILSEMTFVVSYAQTDSSSGDDSDDESLIWDSNYTQQQRQLQQLLQPFPC